MAEFISSEEMERASGMKEELEAVESGLREWEIRFIQDLSDWEGTFTRPQFDTLEDIWGKHL